LTLYNPNIRFDLHLWKPLANSCQYLYLISKLSYLTVILLDIAFVAGVLSR